MNDYMSKPITQLKALGYTLSVVTTYRGDMEIAEMWSFRQVLSDNLIEFNITNKTVGFNGHFELEEIRILMGVIELWGLL